jgi:NADH-quinone oxidoreductase subunit A
MGTVWPIGLYFGLCVVLIVGMLIGSYLLGQRHDERATGSPYESGIVSQGSARVRFSARYYLISMLFVIFDLEAVFVFAWAVAVREVGWPGYFEILMFIGILVAAWLYLWRVGALDWSLEPRRRREAISRQHIGAASRTGSR